MTLGANFDVLLKGLDPELAADVAKLYAFEAAQEALACEADRPIIGRFNAENPVESGRSIGQMLGRIHSTDFFAQQVIHRAAGDPDLWKWFAKTPEGAYTRPTIIQKPRIVVPEWRGGLWGSVRSAVSN